MNMEQPTQKEGGVEMEAKLKPYVRDVVDTVLAMARKEYDDDNMIISDLEKRMSYLTWEERHIIGAEAKKILASKMKYATEVENFKLLNEIKMAISKYWEGLFGIDIVDDKHSGKMSEERIILDDIANRIFNAIMSEYDIVGIDKLNFESLFNELKDNIRGRVGTASFVNNMRSIPKIVEEKLKNSRTYYSEKLRKHAIEKLKIDVENAIKSESGPYNN